MPAAISSTSLKKGRQKTGGRKKGSLNKQTRDIKEIHGQMLEAISGNITIEELVEITKPDTLVNYIAKALPQNLNIKADINSPPAIININGKTEIDK